MFTEEQVALVDWLESHLQRYPAPCWYINEVYGRNNTPFVNALRNELPVCVNGKLGLYFGEQDALGNATNTKEDFPLIRMLVEYGWLKAALPGRWSLIYLFGDHKALFRERDRAKRSMTRRAQGKVDAGEAMLRRRSS